MAEDQLRAIVILRGGSCWGEGADLKFRETLVRPYLLKIDHYILDRPFK